MLQGHSFDIFMEKKQYYMITNFKWLQEYKKLGMILTSMLRQTLSASCFGNAWNIIMMNFEIKPLIQVCSYAISREIEASFL